MVGGADATGQADEASGNGVAEPNTQPRLPPGETTNDHGRRDHPGVDVERVGDPEGDEVPRTPLPALGLHRLEIMVRQLCEVIAVSKSGLSEAPVRAGGAGEQACAPSAGPW